MDLELRSSADGRLLCAISHGGERAEFGCGNASLAIRSLQLALDELTVNGCSECYWQAPEGSYRWMFRQQGDLLRVAVVWSAGVVTGWEHVFWTEGACTEIFEPLRAAAESRSATL